MLLCDEKHVTSTKLQRFKFSGSVWFLTSSWRITIHEMWIKWTREWTYKASQSCKNQKRKTGQKKSIRKKLKHRSKRFIISAKSEAELPQSRTNLLSIECQNVSITQKPQERQQNDYYVLFATQRSPLLSSFLLRMLIFASKHLCFFPFNHHEEWVHFCDAFYFLCWLNSSSYSFVQFDTRSRGSEDSKIYFYTQKRKFFYDFNSRLN